jgi:hypothetical protein
VGDPKAKRWNRVELVRAWRRHYQNIGRLTRARLLALLEWRWPGVIFMLPVLDRVDENSALDDIDIRELLGPDPGLTRNCEPAGADGGRARGRAALP